VNLSVVRAIEQIDRTAASPVRADLRAPTGDAEAMSAAIARIQEPRDPNKP